MRLNKKLFRKKDIKKDWSGEEYVDVEGLAKVLAWVFIPIAVILCSSLIITACVNANSEHNQRMHKKWSSVCDKLSGDQPHYIGGDTKGYSDRTSCYIIKNEEVKEVTL